MLSMDVQRISEGLNNKKKEIQKYFTNISKAKKVHIDTLEGVKNTTVR